MQISSPKLRCQLFLGNTLLEKHLTYDMSPSASQFIRRCIMTRTDLRKPGSRTLTQINE